MIERLSKWTRDQEKVPPKETRPPRGMHSRIDAAQTTPENRNHWSNADSLSPDVAFNPAIRQTLRNRARYEGVNSCYVKGDIRSSAEDLIGTGPRLQLTVPGFEEEAKVVEQNHALWCAETLLPINLRIAEKSHIRDGGCFALFETNERLKNAVKFDLQWLEVEFCQSPMELVNDPYVADGIRFDRFGKPLLYYFLKQHPGSSFSSYSPAGYYTVPAENVIHWMGCPDRFGQHHGIPEITPALPLYAQLRRYTLATLTAAEFASMIAGIIESTLPPEENVARLDRWELAEFVRGALLTMPDGYKASQMKAEQPTTTYPMFKGELLSETGRATGKPRNSVSGDSSQFNFASGRMDHLPYHRGIRISRNDLKLIALDRIFRDGWYPEALMVGEVPANLPPIAQWRWSWNWDGFDAIDPLKDSNANDCDLKNGTSTYAGVLSEYGVDWQEHFEQLAREKAEATRLGLPWPILSNAPTSPQAPAAENAEAAVQAALDEADLSAEAADEIMAALRPTFAEVRSRLNGRFRKGVGV